MRCRNGKLLDLVCEDRQPGAISRRAQHPCRSLQECRWDSSCSLARALLHPEEGEHQRQCWKRAEGQELQVDGRDWADQLLLGHPWPCRWYLNPEQSQRWVKGILLQDEGWLPTIYRRVFRFRLANTDRLESPSSLWGSLWLRQTVTKQHAPA